MERGTRQEREWGVTMGQGHGSFRTVAGALGFTLERDRIAGVSEWRPEVT